MFLLVFLLSLCGVLYLYLKKRLSYWKERNVPHRPSTSVLGNFSLLVWRSIPPGEFFGGLYNECQERYFGFYAFVKPCLVIKDLDIIKRVLIKDFHIFSNRFSVSDEKVDPFLSNSLFGIRTPQWKILRTKLSPVFSSGKIRAMLPLMVDCSNNLIDYGNSHLDQSVEIKDIASKYTTDVIASCAFGITANSFLYKDSEFRVAGQRLFRTSLLGLISGLAYFFAPTLVKLFKFKFVEPQAANWLKKVFNETIKKREESKIRRNDLIDILIELKASETSDDEFMFYGDRVVAQAVNFFGAGQETSSSVIAFTLHELCIHTSIQDRLRVEINELLEKYGGLTYEAVLEMKYLDMIVSETLRKYPLTPFIGRVCEEDYLITETGLVIEKGTPILISQNGLHWDPKYFPNPGLFNPERFSQENKEGFPTYAYLPFGNGPRNCIGERFGLLSSKLGIIQVIRNFQVTRSSDTCEPLVFGRSPLLQAVPGVFVTFKKLPKI